MRRRYLLFLVLILSSLAFSLELTPLWPGGERIDRPDFPGPGVLAVTNGVVHLVSSESRWGIINSTGVVTDNGINPTGIPNIVAPPIYITRGGANYTIAYVTAFDGQNSLILRETNTATSVNIPDTPSSSYGLTGYYNQSDNQYRIYFGSMNGRLYFYNTGTTLTSTNVSAPIKAPPVLSPKKDFVYFITQNGKFYRQKLNTNGTFDGDYFKVYDIADEFNAPMAMDENGFIYVASSKYGRIYKLNPAESGNAIPQSALIGDIVNSASVLIDGNGYIYTFGNSGTVAVFDSNLTFYDSYVITDFNITTTPAIVRGFNGKTYILIASTHSNAQSGKLTVLMFDIATNKFSLVTEKILEGPVSLASAVGVGPTGSVQGDDYYFVIATTNGKIYGWKINGRGPFGSWAQYGQNIYRTNFIDSSSVAFSSFIKLVAQEGYSSRLLSPENTHQTYYGLFYNATRVNLDGTIGATYTSPLRTNAPNGLAGNAGTQRLEVAFTTTSTSAILFKEAFLTGTVKGSPGITQDATFTFESWKSTGPGDVKPPAETHPDLKQSTATIAFTFSDREVNVLADATYLVYVYHKAPTFAATNIIQVPFVRDQFLNNQQTYSTYQIDKTNNASFSGYFPYKWEVYQWDPNESLKYKRTTYGNEDFVKIVRNGPAYIEAYYSVLSATLTTYVPPVVYGPTKAYLILRAASGTNIFRIEFKPKNGIKLIPQNVLTEYATSVSAMNDLVNNQNEFSVTLQSFQNPLTQPSVVATITLSLFASTPTNMNFVNNSDFEQYFDKYGYAYQQGQLIEFEELKAKKVFITNKLLFIVGDFNNDLKVDINDWNLFVQKYNTTVSATDLSYNIGPREDFVPPYPNSSAYSPGILKDNGENKVDFKDLIYFGAMFGFAITTADLFN